MKAIGIRINAVAPGVIDTDMSNFTKTEAGLEVTLGMQALKRIGKPEDVADVVAFLASDGGIIKHSPAMTSTFIDVALVLSTPGLQRFCEFGDGFGVHAVVFDGVTRPHIISDSGVQNEVDPR